MSPNIKCNFSQLLLNDDRGGLAACTADTPWLIIMALNIYQCPILCRKGVIYGVENMFSVKQEFRT
jgi:hypothetical protein